MTNQKPKIEYDWNSWKAEIKFQGKEKLSGDKLKRKDYAEFLTEYLNKAGEREGGYVMNPNAEWGAGKTWFLKRWCETLRPHHPVAYIDAWKNDFSDDPLLTVIDSVIKALRSNPNVRALDYEDRLFSKLKLIGKASAEAALKHAKLDSFGEILGLHREKAGNIEESRKLISRWLSDVVSSPINENYRSPMYIFIDELDRCRPTYAIELLETVKHLFELQNIVFVIATNTDQLQHSIKAVYGEGFDASRYLYRFFRRSFSLRPVSLLHFVSESDSFKAVSGGLLCVADNGVSITKDGLANFLCSVAEYSNFDLRTTEQWLNQLEAIYATESNQHRYFWGVVAILLAMRLQNADYYFYHLGLSKSYRKTDSDGITKPENENFLMARSSSNPLPSRTFELRVSTRCLKRWDKSRDAHPSKGESVPQSIISDLTYTGSVSRKWSGRDTLSHMRSKDIPFQINQKFWDGKDPSEEAFLLAFFHFKYLNQETEFHDYINLVEMGASIGD